MSAHFIPWLSIFFFKKSAISPRETNKGFFFQFHCYRVVALRAETSPGAERSAGAQRKPAGCGPAVRSPQHHLQHGPDPHLLLLRPPAPPHSQIHTGEDSSAGCLQGNDPISNVKKSILAHLGNWSECAKRIRAFVSCQRDNALS